MKHYLQEEILPAYIINEIQEEQRRRKRERPYAPPPIPVDDPLINPPEDIYRKPEKKPGEIVIKT